MKFKKDKIINNCARIILTPKKEYQVVYDKKSTLKDYLKKQEEQKPSKM